MFQAASVRCGMAEVVQYIYIFFKMGKASALSLQVCSLHLSHTDGHSSHVVAVAVFCFFVLSFL